MAVPVGTIAAQVLVGPATRIEALEIVRALLARVVLHPVDGGFEIELAGEIATMVAVAHGAAKRKKAAPAGAAFDDHRCPVKVVAGARYRRDSHKVKISV